MREWLALAFVVTLLWSIHIVTTARTGLTLPDEAREVYGASASTVWTRLHAQFTAPLFHDGIAHLAYNTILFAIAIPFALRAGGWATLGLAFLASPLVGVLVDVAIILPLAKAGYSVAVAAAPVRLVGASIVAFALVGIALGAWTTRAGTLPVAAVVGGLVLYELVLAVTGTTRPFVWAYHLGGLAVGLGLAARL